MDNCYDCKNYQECRKRETLEDMGITLEEVCEECDDFINIY